MIRSQLYFGTVSHRRLRPRVHALKYRMFWTLLDLDDIPDLPKRSALFSYNRFNVLSFHDADHGDGSGGALRPQIERMLDEHGIAFDGGSILLFCMPRVLGYGFNPISVYFCHLRDGSLAAIVYEVHNTFGERHSYVFDAHEKTRPAAHGCDKRFHVSPFMDMGMHYEFRTLLPAERFALAIRGSDADGALIHASLACAARSFHTLNLLRGLLLYPLLTLKVTAAIHWHALRLWLKGIRVRHKPEPPLQPTTVVSSIPRS
nr:DUF1365 family protein [Mesorhizobium sp.]